MTFYPIVIPITSETDVLYYFPGWLSTLLFGSMGIALFGTLLLIISAVGFLVFDAETEKLGTRGLAVVLVGLFLLVCCLPLMLVFGVRME
jgi:hypothetical protein